MPATLHPIRDRADAEAQVCAAIATLGRLAGIDVDLGDGPDDIDANLIQAAYESNFDDPHFLGGPGCFLRAATPADAGALATRASAVTRGLANYIRTRRSTAALHDTSSSLAAIEAAFTWLALQTGDTPHRD